MTEAQKTAARPDLSAWVSANAGTGKTYVLTRRVLRLLLEGADPHRILCLTFTKAAAAEMANRLNSELSEWVTLDDGKLAEKLKDLTGDAPSPSQIAEARQLFPKVLDAPGGLRIQTFHSFCESLLARFPLEAGISPNARVMDEKAAAEVRMDASRRLLAQAQEDKDGIGRYFEALAGTITDNQFDELMSRLLYDRPKINALAETFRSPAEIEAALFARLGLDPAESAESLVAAACADTAFDGPALAQAARKLADGPDTGRTAAAAILDWLDKDAPGRQADWNEYQFGLLTQTGTPRAKLLGLKLVKEDDSLRRALESEQARLMEVNEKCAALEVARLSASLAVVAIELVSLYDRLKSLHNRHDFDDLIHKARDLVNPDQNGPMAAAWVLFKLDEGLDHILVDEAQDSNSDQWDVIDPLGREFFSGEGRSNRPRTIFAVGDPKQSIYSFQGAEPREFESRQIEFSRLVRESGQTFERPVLDRSFRSTPAVLNLVDEVFSDETAKAGLVFTDEPERARIHHEANRADAPGLVELWEPELKEPTEDEEDWDPPVVPKPWTDPKTRLAHRIARQIRTWIDDDKTLTARERPIRPGDILVLVRRRNEFVNALVKSLKQRGVDVAGVDRLMLTDQIAVKDLLSLAAFTLQPQDDLKLAEVLRSPLIGFSEDQLEEVATGRGKDTPLWRALWDHARQNATAEGAVGFLQDCLGRADRVSPYEFFAQLLDGMQGRRRLLARLGREASDAIDEFLNQALDYERANAPSLQGFVHWVTAAETEVKREQEEGRDEVRIMTVHGAKGLQAPVVILADTLSTPKNNQSPNIFWLADPATDADLPFWAPKKEDAIGDLGQAYDTRISDDIAEYQRLLYVALTRAEDELYITGFGAKPDTGCWYETVKAAFDRLSETGAVSELSDSQGRRILRYDSGKTPKPEQHKPSGIAVVSPLPGWVARPAPKEPDPPSPLAPSRPSESEQAVRSPTEGGELKDRFQRGNLIHALLQYLPGTPAGGWEAKARAYLSQPGHGLSPEQIEDWTAEVLVVLHHPDFAPLFGPASRAEVPVSGLVGALPVSGQIDRLAVENDRVLIVDYKTNRPPPGSPEDVAPLYLRQLAAYRALLARIYPGKDISCALLWTDAPALMEIPASLLDAHTPSGNTVS